jgi:hypothetical protein
VLIGEDVRFVFVCAAFYPVSLTLTAPTPSLPGWAGTSNSATVAYEVSGTYASPNILCHGHSDCDNGKIASTSTALTEVPTKMKLTIDGTDGWGFDSLSLSLTGKTCDIVSGWHYTDASGGNCLDADTAACSSEKTFDLYSCVALYPASLTLTAHTPSSPGWAGTSNSVTAAYEVSGSYTSPSCLCHRHSDCDPGKTASASTALTEVLTRMKLTIDGTDGWGFDSLSLSLNGKTCNIVSSWHYTDASGGNCLDADTAACSSEKTFDLSSCAALYPVSLTLTAHTPSSPGWAGTSNSVNVAYEVSGSYTSPSFLCHGHSDCDTGKTASASTALTEVPTKMKFTIDGIDGWGFDLLSLSLNGKTCDIVSGWLYTDVSGGNCLGADTAACSSENTFDFSSCAALYPVSLTLAAHTPSLPDWAGTSNSVTVAYEALGSYTSPSILCHGHSDCDTGKTASASTALTEVPTKMKFTIDGTDGWGLDSLSLSLNGKTCDIVSGGHYTGASGEKKPGRGHRRVLIGEDVRFVFVCCPLPSFSDVDGSYAQFAGLGGNVEFGHRGV